MRNVTTIFELRAYSAGSPILPEQTLGRGQRRMWPVAAGDLGDEVIVIEHQAFRQFWDRELHDEGFDIERVPVAKVRPTMRTVLVDKSKLDYEIEVPRLTPSLAVAVPDLSQIDIQRLPVHRLHLPLGGAVGEEPLVYTGRDMLTREVVDQAEFERDFPADPAGYLNVIGRSCSVSVASRTCRTGSRSSPR